MFKNILYGFISILVVMLLAVSWYALIIFGGLVVIYLFIRFINSFNTNMNKYNAVLNRKTDKKRVYPQLEKKKKKRKLLKRSNLDILISDFEKRFRPS